MGLGVDLYADCFDGVKCLVIFLWFGFDGDLRVLFGFVCLGDEIEGLGALRWFIFCWFAYWGWVTGLRL